MISSRHRDSKASEEEKSRSALLQAYDLTKKASRLGFDWPDVAGVLSKMDEEIRELKEALSNEDRKEIENELGDLFFVLVNVARFLRISPEKALLKTIDKFNSRFDYVKTSLRKMGKSVQQSDLAEMERLWQKAKREKRRVHHGPAEKTEKGNRDMERTT